MKRLTAKQQLETQIKEENETYETLSGQIVLSPRKLKVEILRPIKSQQEVVDNREKYSRFTAECRTLTNQLTDLQAQSAVMEQASEVVPIRGYNVEIAGRCGSDGRCQKTARFSERIGETSGIAEAANPRLEAAAHRQNHRKEGGNWRNVEP